MVKQVILACRPLDHLPGKEPWPPTPAKCPAVHVTARSLGLMGESGCGKSVTALSILKLSLGEYAIGILYNYF